MKRRNFIARSLAVSATAVGGPLMAGDLSTSLQEKHSFKLKYAPHNGQFKHHAGEDIIDQIKFASDVGFTAWEDNGMLKREMGLQDKIGSTLAQLGMTMGVFVVDGGDNWKISLTTGKAEFLDVFVKTCERCVDVAKRVNAKWMTVVPGYFERTLPMGVQTANVIEALRRGADVFEPHGLTMVLEPLSDNPDLFLRTSDQTYMICKAVDSPSCKILYDIYHMQKNEGHLIHNIDLVWDEIAYFQIGDNPGRKEPTTGEIHYKNIFKHIYEKDPNIVMGMEHGISGEGVEGELRLIEAYAEVDDFEV
jgi:hydroxypyruvate isomerase